MKVGIVDDNFRIIQVTRDKLALFDDVEIAMVATSGKECLEYLESNSLLDILLMDIEMPELNGIETVEICKKKYPHIKVIMFTVVDAEENVFKSVLAGANGYLLKEIEADKLHAALVDTQNGGAIMSPSIAQKTLQFLRFPELTESFIKEDGTIELSKRETQVLEQISQGLSATSVAKNLFISPGTVRKHIENIYQKLNVNSRIEAIQKARRHHLL